ncbi:MAG: hypothetical protein OXG68_00870 [Chloroflexi bacterium]|nr:hypothetical protein [Chloroflexota bacterium]
MAKAALKLSAEQKQFEIETVANGRAPFAHREEARLHNIYSQEVSLVTSGQAAHRARAQSEQFRPHGTLV